MIKILSLVICLSIVNASVLPVEKCNLSDSKCLKTEFQKAVPVFMNGIPDLGLDVLDVMDMEDFKFDLAGLQFSLSDGKLKGLKNSIIDSVKWDTKNKKFEVVFHVDTTIKGHYTAAGRILILPITGDGQMKLKLKNVEIKLFINYDIEKKDGTEFFIPKSFDVSFDVKDNAQYQLTNLFNGNKELSDAMLTFLNQNWKQISVEFGKPMIDVTAKSIFKNIQGFFKNNPMSDIAEY